MKKFKQSSPIKKIIWGIIILAIVSLSIWGIQWATFARPPLQEAIDALENTNLVSVTDDPWLTFTPTTKSPNAIYSRAVSGIAKKSFIVNLPGSPKAVKEILEFLLTSIEHPLKLILKQLKDCQDDLNQ